MPVQNTRARRTLLTLAAAAAVVLLPTACDYAVADTGGTDYGLPSGHSGHGGPTVSDVETVPVGDVEELDPTEPGPDDPAQPDSGQADPGPAEPGAGEEAEAVDPEAGDGGAPAPGTAEEAEDPAAETEPTEEPTTSSSAPPVAAPPATGLDILGVDCTESQLAPHDGFQNSPRCVAIAFGEVAAEALSPSLLITEAPATVAPGQDFTLTVSTRNLVRDRFLGAAAGGYYRESSFLNDQGVQRGHFHTACRVLSSTAQAPDAALVPEFFLATQDNGGGSSEPDQVVVPIEGEKITGAGTLQCAVWAGDGSHRVPMLTRANQTPAFDIVRIEVG